MVVPFELGALYHYRNEFPNEEETMEIDVTINRKSDSVRDTRMSDFLGVIEGSKYIGRLFSALGEVADLDAIDPI